MGMLENLYDCNIKPKNISYSSIDTEVNSLQRIGVVEDKLKDTMDEKQKELFKKYRELTAVFTEVCKQEAFADGFALGAKIVTEALSR